MLFIEEVSPETEANEDPVVKTPYRKSSLHTRVLRGNIKTIVSGKESTKMAEGGR